MAQPNSGRIGRSPGAVERIRRMLCSISASSPTRRIPPVASVSTGKAQPRPMNVWLIVGPPSVERDRGAVDVHARTAVDLHAARALELELAVGLDRDAGRGLDRHVLR